MAENLKVTHYNNSDIIENVTDDWTWSGLTTGAYSIYNNGGYGYLPEYGALYNWYVVEDSRNVCPSGWHVPSYDEWNTLSEHLGVDDAGNKMREAGTEHWPEPQNPNVIATNESGFTGLPGGVRVNYDGSFTSSGSGGYWWTTTPHGTGGYYKSASLRWDLSELSFGSQFEKENGLSIRCIRN